MSGDPLIDLSEVPVSDLTLWTCTKKVRALKIVEELDQDELTLTLVVKCERDILYRIVVTREFVVKRNLQLEGYIVIYEDGYVSYSPLKAFEEGYTLQQQ